MGFNSGFKGLMKHHSKNTCVVMKVQLHAFLSWVLTGGEW